MAPRIAYVTQRGEPADPEAPLAVAALGRHGLQAEALPWDGPAEWADYDLVLVRSAWDLGPRRQEFLRWARAVEDVTVLANPARTLARNSDRGYLRDLRRRGVDTVDTVWFEPGDDPQACAAALADRQWPGHMVAPTIGTAPAQVAVEPSAAAEQAAALAARGSLVMIQPLLPAGSGAVSVIVLGGRVSHAVRGGSAIPLPDDLALLLPGLLDAGSDGEDLLYIRLDMLPDGGRWLLLAFDATTPALALDADPAAADRLARAVRAAVTGEG